MLPPERTVKKGERGRAFCWRFGQVGGALLERLPHDDNRLFNSSPQMEMIETSAQNFGLPERSK